MTKKSQKKGHNLKKACANAFSLNQWTNLIALLKISVNKVHGIIFLQRNFQKNVDSSQTKISQDLFFSWLTKPKDYRYYCFMLHK